MFAAELGMGRPVVTEREVVAGTIPGLDAEALDGQPADAYVQQPITTNHGSEERFGLRTGSSESYSVDLDLAGLGSWGGEEGSLSLRGLSLCLDTEPGVRP